MKTTDRIIPNRRRRADGDLLRPDFEELEAIMGTLIESGEAHEIAGDDK